MSDDNQIIIPQSFIALFIESGRIKPNAPREIIAARYELCEDLASLLTERPTLTQWELGVTEDAILERIHRGLLIEPSQVKPEEALWVTRRLAELLDWDCPPFDDDAHSGQGEVSCTFDEP